MMDYKELIDNYYPKGTRRREIFLKHSCQVTELALEIAERKKLALDRELIRQAAMLHDIGICMTDASNLDCHGKAHYLLHGLLGAKLLRDHGFSEVIAQVAIRHTGTGLSAEDVSRIIVPRLQDVEIIEVPDMMPRTELECLVCYSDKFYSKSGTMQRKSLEQARASVAKFGEASALRFDALSREFE